MAGRLHMVPQPIRVLVVRPRTAQARRPRTAYRSTGQSPESLPLPARAPHRGRVSRYVAPLSLLVRLFSLKAEVPSETRLWAHAEQSPPCSNQREKPPSCRCRQTRTCADPGAQVVSAPRRATSGTATSPEAEKSEASLAVCSSAEIAKATKEMVSWREGSVPARDPSVLTDSRPPVCASRRQLLRPRIHDRNQYPTATSSVRDTAGQAPSSWRCARHGRRAGSQGNGGPNQGRKTIDAKSSCHPGFWQYEFESISISGAGTRDARRRL